MIVPKRLLLVGFAIACLAMLIAGRVEAGLIISPGTPTTTVPAYLTDGSYLFGITIPTPLSPGEFLLPVNITGATNLQNWGFDLSFNSSVVQEVDPGDGTAGIYGAEFTAGDQTTLSFILGGFPLNPLGQVQGVAGSYPSLLVGPSGDGPLAYILFQFQQGQEGNNPGFSVANTTVVQGAPEPATLFLLATGLVILGGRHRREQHS